MNFRESLLGAMRRYWRIGVAYIIILVALVSIWCVFNAETGVAYPSFIGTAMKVTGDMMLILAPYWLLRGKWRIAVIAPLWIYAFWCLCNVAYFRFWGDLIPFSAFVMAGNVNADLWGYAFSLLRVGDWAYPAIAIAATVFSLLLLHGKEETITRKYKLWTIGISILIFLAGQFSYFKSHASWKHDLNATEWRQSLYDHYFGGYADQRTLYSANGVCYYGVRFVYDAIDLKFNSIRLSPKQSEEISEFINKYDIPDLNINKSDSLNIIYIIMESLNSEMVNMHIGSEAVMPALDSLSRAYGTLYFPHVVSQVKDAGSSDGHLILLTGLLPLQKGPYSMMYGSSNTFPALAKRFPNHSKQLLLADAGNCWNEKNTLQQFGHGNAVTIDEMKFSADRYGRDGALYKQAAAMLDTIKSPFFMTLMTMSMHVPFEESAWKQPDFVTRDSKLTDIQQRYITTCYWSDFYLREFLKHVPANTVVVIASDHTQPLTHMSADDELYCVFMVLNSGMSRRVDRVVGQVNLYPAVVELLGLPGRYDGVAESALNGKVTGAADGQGRVHGKLAPQQADTLRNAYRISDMIIRSDYFKGVPIYSSSLK